MFKISEQASFTSSNIKLVLFLFSITVCNLFGVFKLLVQAGSHVLHVYADSSFKF